MKKVLTTSALAALCALATLAAFSGSARATYPGATNGRLAFGMSIGGNVDIYSALPNGNDLRRLTSDASFDACAAYSPSGNEIAFCSNRSGNFEIWAMKQNGKQEHQVTHTGGRMIFPDFSPDGTKIAFSGHLAGGTNEDIFVANTDGSGLVQLTTSPAKDAYPAWSPDGSKIAFTSDRTGTAQVYVMNADGSDQTQLTSDPLPKDQVPDWSPDGSKIAYLADTHGIADQGNSWGDIWVMNADGSDQHAITSGATYYGTAWSPDGTRIATVDFPIRTVYTVDASDGGDPQAVPGPGAQFVPGWQPRGVEDSRLRPASANAIRRAARATTIRVSTHNSRYVLSAKSAPRGVVIFKITNPATQPHDFSINGRTSKLLTTGQSTTLRVTFRRKGHYVYKDTFDHHASFGCKGGFKIT